MHVRTGRRQRHLKRQGHCMFLSSSHIRSNASGARAGSADQKGKRSLSVTSCCCKSSPVSLWLKVITQEMPVFNEIAVSRPASVQQVSATQLAASLMLALQAMTKACWQGRTALTPVLWQGTSPTSPLKYEPGPSGCF